MSQVQGNSKPFGTSFRRTILLRLFLIGSCLWGLPSCGPDKAVVAAKETFLQETSPQLKVIRDRLLAELSSCESSIKELKTLAKSFNQSSAKEAVEKKMAALESRGDALKKQLSRIEEEVEKGVALRSFNQIDGGGMVEQDLAGIMKDSESALGSAKQTRAQMATELGQPSIDLAAESISASITSRGRKDQHRAPENVSPSWNSQRNQDASHTTTWTNQEGKSIQAELVTLEGENVLLRLPDGRTHLYPIEQLSASSQSLARRLALSQVSPPKLEQPIGESLFYRIIKTTDGYLNVRRGPGLRYAVRGRILGTARGIEQIGNLILDQQDSIYWMPIRFGGVDGYVSANFLQPE